MKVVLKIALIVIIVLVALIPLEFWFRLVILGRQYEVLPFYQIAFYTLLPIAILAGVSWLIRRIARAKFDFN